MPYADTITDTTKALEARLARLEREVEARNGKEEKTRNGVAIVCFSGEWDRLYAAFTIANGALAMGNDVDMFFTFWGATAIRNEDSAPSRGKSMLQRAFGMMLPRSVRATPLSRMNFCGLGKVMLGRLIRQKNVDDLPTLVEQARELGARFHCCETSLHLFGWKCADLADGENADWCGVASFLAMASKREVTLFI